VDAAHAGDTVLVTNGVYAVGRRTSTNDYGVVSGNRVFIENAIRLESVNGPLVTTVVGWRTDVTNELGEVVGCDMGRCVYLGSNAVLSGFTLTNGSLSGFIVRGGGVRSERSGVVTNCTLTGNHVFGFDLPVSYGGGAYGGSLYNCTLTGNSVAYVSGGGGASDSTLCNCTLIGNWATVGAGASESTLYNCTVTGNYGSYSGGGAIYSTLCNCTVTGNSASEGGGGASGCILYNCTVTGNDGGGIGSLDNVGSTILNSVVYGNTNGNYMEGTILNYCLTTPLPSNGGATSTPTPVL
jgi:hypothetical protein